MATKVFLRFNRDIRDVYVKGREYEVLQRTDGLIRAKSELGIEFFDFETNKKYFDVIEREDSTTFEAHGHTWTRHTPGDPMPCDGDRVVVLLFQSGRQSVAAPASVWAWGDTFHDKGWRFAYQEPEAKPCGPIESIINRVCNEYSIADADESGLYHDTAHKDKGHGRAAKTGTRKKTDESERNDLKPAAIEDSHLTPSQRRHWNEMEERQAQKEQAAAAQAELKKSEQAKALQEAADAMGKVNQDHGHKLGWCHEA